jgi:hypothetical protein
VVERQPPWSCSDQRREMNGAHTLLAPMTSSKTYLIDMEGKVVRKWESDATPATCAYLLPNGHLLRPAALRGKDQPKLNGPGVGGRIQEFDWAGKLVWNRKSMRGNPATTA